MSFQFWLQLPGIDLLRSSRIKWYAERQPMLPKRLAMQLQFQPNPPFQASYSAGAPFLGNSGPQNSSFAFSNPSLSTFLLLALLSSNPSSPPSLFCA